MIYVLYINEILILTKNLDKKTDLEEHLEKNYTLLMD